MQVERGCAGHNDEPSNYVSKDAADDYIKFRGIVLAARNTFFDDRGLQIELHPGRDRGTDNADHHVEVSTLLEGVQIRRLDRSRKRMNTCELGQYSRKYVSDVEKR